MDNCEIIKNQDPGEWLIKSPYIKNSVQVVGWRQVTRDVLVRA